MFAVARRYKHKDIDIWPGFVDALAALLLVVIFVLMTFVVSQFYLTDALVGRDAALAKLNTEIDNLSATLGQEKLTRQEVEMQLAKLDKILGNMRTELASTKLDLQTAHKDILVEAQAKDNALSKIMRLSRQINQLNAQIQALNEALSAEEAKLQNKNIEMQQLGDRLNVALLEKVKELKELNEKLLQLQTENISLGKKIVTLDGDLKKAIGPVGQYRSEFFAKLKTALGDRKDIRIVGDRFVFQSEVLFSQGSAVMGEEGKVQLDQLAKTLKEIAATIPKDVQWILRVDGHTDSMPIKNNQFQSNWELSSGRAISVVKYLISQGINSHRLVAAGFGEHQPLEKGKAAGKMARNRRIEFKLDRR